MIHLIMIVVAIFDLATLITFPVALRAKKISTVIITAVLAACVNEAAAAVLSSVYTSHILHRISAQLLVGLLTFFIMLKRRKRREATPKKI